MGKPRFASARHCCPGPGLAAVAVESFAPAGIFGRNGLETWMQHAIVRSGECGDRRHGWFPSILHPCFIWIPATLCFSTLLEVGFDLVSLAGLRFYAIVPFQEVVAPKHGDREWTSWSGVTHSAAERTSPPSLSIRTGRSHEMHGNRLTSAFETSSVWSRTAARVETNFWAPTPLDRTQHAPHAVHAVYGGMKAAAKAAAAPFAAVDLRKKSQRGTTQPSKRSPSQRGQSKAERLGV
jgi:hypothetical protein